MSIYEVLWKNQRKTRYLDSEEFDYYRSNSPVLSSLSSFEFLLKPENTFDVVRANIVIRGLFAKRQIEAAYKQVQSLKKKDPGFDIGAYMDGARKNLPYHEVGDVKIYIPIFAVSVNRLYGGDMAALSKEPYDSLLKDYGGLLVDPFETYGPPLFSSLFTRLVPVYEDKKSGSAALYDFDAERLYFVDSQGRMDAMLCYFDRYLNSVSVSGILDRSLPVAKAYFAGDRGAMMRALSDGRLVSSRLLHEIEEKRLRK